LSVRLFDAQHTERPEKSFNVRGKTDQIFRDKLVNVVGEWLQILAEGSNPIDKSMLPQIYLNRIQRI